MPNVRNVAIVGPSLSGKTTLLESVLFATGAIGRKGSVKDGNTVGDAAPEARARQMSTEVTATRATFGDITFNILDCPGSIEFQGETRNALIGVRRRHRRVRTGDRAGHDPGADLPLPQRAQDPHMCSSTRWTAPRP